MVSDRKRLPNQNQIHDCETAPLSHSLKLFSELVQDEIHFASQVQMQGIYP